PSVLFSDGPKQGEQIHPDVRMLCPEVPPRLLSRRLPLPEIAPPKPLLEIQVSVRFKRDLEFDGPWIELKLESCGLDLTVLAAREAGRRRAQPLPSAKCFHPLCEVKLRQFTTGKRKRTPGSSSVEFQLIPTKKESVFQSPHGLTLRMDYPDELCRVQLTQ